MQAFAEGKERLVIFTELTNRREAVLLENQTGNIERDDFLRVEDAREVPGEGFKSIWEVRAGTETFHAERHLARSSAPAFSLENVCATCSWRSDC